MSFRRRTYVLLVLAVIVASIATHAFRPGGQAGTACGIRDITLAVEVCPTTDVDAILGEIGSETRAQLHDQTLVDFALIAAYVALWVATGLALNPGVAILAGLAGVADVVENLAILQELPLADPVPFVRVAALAKWTLLGVVFITFVFLFRPGRLSGGWRGLLRAATGLAYGLTGVAALGGLVDVRSLTWAGPPLMAAVLLQLLLHLLAHGEFRAARDQRLAARISTAPSLSLQQVLAEEYERIHGPLGAAAGGGLAGLYEAIHTLGEKRAALCLSGGGIRSATFALGILQGLARLRMLPRFHYLSTVSGGGYIGSWLTAWLHRSGNDVDAVCEELGAIDGTRKLAPEAETIAHLRDYSNYLAPRAGLLSADTWTLLGTIMRNLFLVWSVVLPLLAAGLIVPRLYLALAHSAPGSPAVSAVGGRMLLALGALALAWAVAYIGASIPSSTTALRDQNRFLVWCLVPLLISVLCLTLYWAWWPTRQWRHFVGLALVVHLIAWLGYTIWLRTPWGAGRRAEGSPLKRASAVVAEFLIVVIAGVAAGYLAFILSNVFFPRLDGFLMLYTCLALGVFLSAFLLAATLLVGLISRWTEDEDREWWARGGSWMLLIGVVWIVLSALHALARDGSAAVAARRSAVAAARSCSASRESAGFVCSQDVCRSTPRVSSAAASPGARRIASSACSIPAANCACTASIGCAARMPSTPSLRRISARWMYGSAQRRSASPASLSAESASTSSLRGRLCRMAGPRTPIGPSPSRHSERGDVACRHWRRRGHADALASCRFWHCQRDLSRHGDGAGRRRSRTGRDEDPRRHRAPPCPCQSWRIAPIAVRHLPTDQHSDENGMGTRRDFVPAPRPGGVLLRIRHSTPAPHSLATTGARPLRHVGRRPRARRARPSCGERLE